MFEWMHGLVRGARLAGLLPTALSLLAGGVVQHLARVGKRPAVQEAMKAEGLLKS